MVCKSTNFRTSERRPPEAFCKRIRIMGWKDVLRLLESVDGKDEIIDAEALEAATATGKGTPEVQVLIARLEYKRRYRKDEDAW